MYLPHWFGYLIENRAINFCYVTAFCFAYLSEGLNWKFGIYLSVFFTFKLFRLISYFDQSKVTNSLSFQNRLNEEIFWFVCFENNCERGEQIMDSSMLNLYLGILIEALVLREAFIFQTYIILCQNMISYD